MTLNVVTKRLIRFLYPCSATLKLHKFYWILSSCLITNNRWAKVSNGSFPKWWIMAYWRFISKPGLFYFINQKLFKLFFIIVDNSVCICWDGENNNNLNFRTMSFWFLKTYITNISKLKGFTKISCITLKKLLSEIYSRKRVGKLWWSALIKILNLSNFVCLNHMRGRAKAITRI